MPEQPRVVDLARARLVAARVVGELDVADAREVLAAAWRRARLPCAARGRCRTARSRLSRADLVDERQRLVGAVQVEAGDVEGVDRLDQQPDAGAPAAPSAAKRRLSTNVVRASPAVDACGQLAGQAVDLRAAERGRVVDGARHAVAELARRGPDGRRCRARRRPSRRRAGCAAPAARPLSRRRGGQLLLVEGVGEQELDGLEAGLGGGLEAVEERQLGEQHRQVGCEFGHGVVSSRDQSQHRAAAMAGRARRVGASRRSRAPRTR